MEDVFYEQMVTDRRKGRSTLLRTAMAAGALLILALLVVFWNIGRYIFVLVFSLCVIFFLLFWRRTDREYEYSFSDGQLDVDVIFSKKSRKHLLTLDSRNIRLMAPAGEPRYQEYFAREYDREVKAADGSPEAEGVYVLIASCREQTYKLTFQPDEHLCRLLKHYAPRAVNLAGGIMKPAE